MVAERDTVSWLRLHLISMKLLMRSRMTDRLDYFATVIGVLFNEVTSIALIWIVVDRFETIGGWSPWEVGLLYGLATFFSRLFSGVFGGVRQVYLLVHDGDLDQFLATPRDPLFLMNARYTGAWKILYNGPVLLLVGICGVQAGVPLTAATLALFLVFAASAVVILFSINLFVASISLWIVSTGGSTGIVELLIREYLRYPIHIYGKVLAGLMTFAVPVAFINYYPAAVLLGKTEDVVFSPHLGYLAPIVALLLLFVSLRLWAYGLTRYESTGT